MAQPHPMRAVKDIKPVQLFDKYLARLSDTMAVMWSSTSGLLLHVLQCLGAFNICTTWGYWIDGKFISLLCLLPGVQLLSLPRKS